MFKGKNIIVVGMARSGIAAAELLIENGAIVTVNDSKSTIDGIESLKAMRDLGGTPSHLNYDMMVLSPGVPTSLPFVVEARKKMLVIGALEVGYRLSKGQFYGITGTNGKTTTTTLTYDIFNKANCDAYAVGNIGQPLASVAAKTTNQSHLITEVSSFQLESTDQFNVHIAAILNLAPDHLNRHKTMENYVNSKLRLTENQTSEDFVVLNYDDEPTRALGGFKAKKVYFSKSPIQEGFYVEDGTIYADFNGKVEIMPISTIKVPGPHNIENVLAAVAISYLAGIDIEHIKEAVSEFKGVEHRIEFVGVYNEMKCYNDSKGTNPESSIVALKSMQSPTLLIAGGMDKGSVFESFVASFDRVKHLILIGETKELIAAEARKKGFNEITFVTTMDEAVKKAYELGEPGDIVLLSPACASWDMYASYEVRGEHFKSCLEMY
jgi:UDP-N-acetylmuramoylalanine--D-glutamate ligase